MLTVIFTTLDLLDTLIRVQLLKPLCPNVCYINRNKRNFDLAPEWITTK